MDALAAALDDLKRRGVRPKYIYTIPTVQNPTGTILSEARRHEMLRLAAQHGVPIFEDDCYADLIWDGRRPPALHAMSKHGGVIHIGSFSKSIAPALRVGYIVADWALLSRMLALKTDAGSGALEQMVLGEFCPAHFDAHVPELTRGLRKKLETLMDALNEQFGTAAEFDDPKGGIFLWVKLPDAGRYAEAVPAGARRRRRHQSRPGMGDRQELTAKAARGCASPIPRMRRSAPASPRSPKSAAANSACRTRIANVERLRTINSQGRPSCGARGGEGGSRGPPLRVQNPRTTCVTCSTSGGEAKQWPTSLRHSWKSAEPRKSTVWFSTVSQATNSR